MRGEAVECLRRGISIARHEDGTIEETRCLCTMVNRIVAISMVKNEADIIESFVRHALLIADCLLVVDHDSTDDTEEILAQLQGEGLPLEISGYAGAGHDQAEVMTGLMYRAIEEYGADIVIPLDADEFLVSPSGGSAYVRRILQGLPVTGVYQCRWFRYELVAPEESQEDYLLSRPARRSLKQDFPSKAIVGRIPVQELRPSLMQGNHALRLPRYEGTFMVVKAEELPDVHLAHFPFRSREQILSKKLCMWLSNCAKFTRYSFSARGRYVPGQVQAEGDMNFFRAFCAGDEAALQLPFLEESVPALLTEYEKECTCLYTGAVRQPLGNVLKLAEKIADAYAFQSIFLQKPSVTLIYLWDGDVDSWQKTLVSLQFQSYTPEECLVVSLQASGGGMAWQVARELAEGMGGSICCTFAELADLSELGGLAVGQYAMYLLPGTVLHKGILDDMTAMLASQPLIKSVIAPAVPRHSALVHETDWLGRENDTIVYMMGDNLAEKCLRFGLPGDWTLSGILFRRADLEELNWLNNFFLEGRCMLATLCNKFFDSRSMLGIICEAAIDLPEEAADKAILREMERFYLLQVALSAGTLSQASCQAAFSEWEAWRESHIGRLRVEADGELCDLYEQLWQG